jgi:hypothetical protein
MDRGGDGDDSHRYSESAVHNMIFITGQEKSSWENRESEVEK